ncbi:MAG: very short patch repair endonuclease [Alphaproteobacteria bacterium]|nr:very short patch repair endonuclease [Alphaproteobacteria bacterium]
MADVFTKEKRSAIMSRVKGRGNAATELKMITILRKHRISGWRRGYPIFGRPDFVFESARLAIFIDGCFWHGCPLHGSIPQTNKDFWSAKLARNQKRDRLVLKTLRDARWKVVRIWQHELSDSSRIARRISRSVHNGCKRAEPQPSRQPAL